MYCEHRPTNNIFTTSKPYTNSYRKANCIAIICKFVCPEGSEVRTALLIYFIHVYALKPYNWITVCIFTHVIMFMNIYLYPIESS